MEIMNVNGVEYKLKLSINKLIDIEDESGKSIDKFSESTSLKDVRLVFHHALRGGNSKYKNTIAQTGGLLNEFIKKNSFEELSRLLGRVMQTSLGNPKKVDAPVEEGLPSN